MFILTRKSSFLQGLAEKTVLVDRARQNSNVSHCEMTITGIFLSARLELVVRWVTRKSQG